MKNTWSEALELFMKECIDSNYNFEDTMIDKLDEILTAEKENLNQLQYVHILYLYMLYYKNANNTNAMRYCGMQIRDIYEYCHKKAKKRPDTLVFEKIDEMNDVVLEDAKKATSFLEDTYLYMKKRLVSLSCGIALIWISITVFLLRNNFLFACVQAFTLCLLNYLFAYPRLISKFHIAQKEALESYVKPELLEFVKKYNF